MEKTDVLILGAGPAGFAASMILSERGYSVEILDAAFFPRPKICGEFLNPQAVRWLSDRGLLAGVTSLNPYVVHGMKISDGRSAFTGRYLPREESRGLAVLRERLDSFLVCRARSAGVVIREGHKAEKLIFEGDRVAGVSGVHSEGERFEKRGRFIVGADGRNNLIGRTLGWVRGIRRLRKYVFLSYFQPLPGLDHFGEVHLVSDGYIGIAPITAELANVALVIDEKVYPSREDSGRFLMRRIDDSPLRDRFSKLSPVAPVISAGPLAFRTTRTSGNNTILIGDACGFIDPFTGEGINHSFIGAEIASEVIDEAFRTGSFEDGFLRRYDHQRKRMLALKYRLQNLLQFAIARPRLAGMLVRRFARRRDMADTIVSVVGGSLPEKEVWSLDFLLQFLRGGSDG